MGLDYVGEDVPASVGDFRLNSGRIMRLFCPTGPVLRTFVQYLVASDWYKHTQPRQGWQYYGETKPSVFLQKLSSHTNHLFCQ